MEEDACLNTMMFMHGCNLSGRHSDHSERVNQRSAWKDAPPESIAFKRAPFPTSVILRALSGQSPTTAVTLTSTAIGVGSALISIVVRAGFGLPSPAKYSA